MAEETVRNVWDVIGLPNNADRAPIQEREQSLCSNGAQEGDLDKAQSGNTQGTSLNQKLEDVEKKLQKSPSVFFIGERNCGKSSIINELLRQTSLPVNENPCTARIVRKTTPIVTDFLIRSKEQSIVFTTYILTYIS
ncbi:hypothetical protein ACROYT_G028892 [Oculina patagonica]